MATKRGKYLEESAQWDARDKYMSFLLDLINSMYVDKVEDNLFAYKVTFKQCYLISKPYIEKHFTEEDYKLFSMDDVNEAYSNLKPSLTDHSDIENKDITIYILELIEKKEERLYELLAMERLLLPSGKDREYIPPGQAIRKKFRI